MERLLRVGCESVGVTVWDTSGLSSYASLRPLVYRDCSVVLLCYAAGGLQRLRGWASEVSWFNPKVQLVTLFFQVRRSCSAPIVLVRTKCDLGPGEGMMAAMAVAEEIGALNWEETSSLTGHNVDLAFSLCGLAVSRRKGRVKRPSSLLLGVKPRAPPLYEDPDKANVARQQGSDTDSLFSPQSRASLVLEPRHSVVSPEVPLRPHSSQSAMIRPSRLYRHSTHRVSQGRLKPVSIPLSPNCDKFSDTSSILSPTGSTVSSLLSHPLHPPFRNSRVLALPSPSSSSNSTFLPFSPVSRSSTDSRDSVNLPDTVTKRGSSLGCGWNLVFQPRIDEGEEENLAMVKRDKQGRRGRTKTNKRDRCALM